MFENPSCSGESAGHEDDHGDADHRFVVVGSGFVVADAAAVLADPREGPLDHPDVRADVKSGTAWFAFDDLNAQGENMFRPDE